MNNLRSIMMSPLKALRKIEKNSQTSPAGMPCSKRKENELAKGSSKDAKAHMQLSGEQRFRKALSMCVFVISPFLLAVIVSLIPVEDKGAFGESEYSGTNAVNNSAISDIWGAIQNGEDINSALSEAGFITKDELNGDWAQEDANRQLISEFSEEIFDVKSVSDPVLNKDLTVFGFNREGNSANTFDWINNALESKGWRYVKVSDAPGYEGGAVFIKEKGLYQWLMVTLMQIGDETSVCIRTQHE